MNILDLKKLMLVPLACCILVQQTDAATMEFDDEKFKVSYEDSTEDIENEFVRLVEREENRLASTPVTVRNGQTKNVSQNLRVAADVVTQCGLDWQKCQLGGVIASVRDNGRCGLCVIKGVKKNEGDPEDNSVTGCLYKTNKASHTERQLICAVRKKWKDSLVGRHFIYTALPPCASGGKATNGNVDCCEWYLKVLDKEPHAEFHIFFRAPTCETMNGYAKFDTYRKLQCLKAFVDEVLGKAVYNIATGSEEVRLGGLGTAGVALLAELEGRGNAQDHSADNCEKVAGYLIKCMFRAMRDEMSYENHWEDVSRPWTEKYAKSVEELYRKLIDCYAGYDAAKKQIHFHCLVASESE